MLTNGFIEYGFYGILLIIRGLIMMHFHVVGIQVWIYIFFFKRSPVHFFSYLTIGPWCDSRLNLTQPATPYSQNLKEIYLQTISMTKGMVDK